MEDFAKYNGDGTILREAQLRLLTMLREFDRICKAHDIPYCISGGTCLGAVRHGGFIPWDDDIDIDIWYTYYEKLKQVLSEELPEWIFVQTCETDEKFYLNYMKLVDKRSKVTSYPANIRRDGLLYKGLSIDIFPFRKVCSYKVRSFIDGIYSKLFAVTHSRQSKSKWRLPISIVSLPFVHLICQAADALAYFMPLKKISHSYGSGLTPKLEYEWMFPPREIKFEGEVFQGPADTDRYLTALYGEYMAVPPEGGRQKHSDVIELTSNEAQ